MSKFLKELGRKELLTPHVDRWFDLKQPKFNDVELPITFVKEEDSYFHPSSHAIGCARTIFSGFDPVLADSIEPRKWNNKVGANGHLWHALIEHIVVNELGYASEYEVPMWAARHGFGRVMAVVSEEQLPADKLWVAKGTMDIPFVKIPGIENEDFLVDIKTMNPDSYMSATPPQYLWLKYQAQMQLYLDWTQTNRGILFCVQAANPFGFKEIIIERDPAIAEMIYQKWDAVSIAVSTGTIPEHSCADPSTCSSNTLYEG